MKPAPFDYVAAESTADAVNHLSTTDREVKVLAGGQSLIPVLNMRMSRPQVLVDITRIADLQQIEVSPAGELRIGAAVRQSDALANPEIRRRWPAVASAIRHIGHPQIRNSGTVCGSLAHADSSAELPAVAVLLDAVIDVTSAHGRREVAAADFFLGTFTTDLAPDELVTSVRFPAPSPGARHDITEFTQRRGDFATVGVATRVSREGDAMARARAVFFGVGSAPVRVPAVEEILTGRAPSHGEDAEVTRAIAAALTPPTDVHASAELRLELAATLLNRSILSAWELC
ncbi:FAD binding domain-containing protein [Janibacter sp. GS2]|uniref:FAD binding domain-containing protein n=1 Tax=Janibacter sp. GS2 TaxID=3442646 RepID=UPI003EB69D7C